MERFDVILTGELLGDTTLETAREGFARLFKLEEAKARAIFSRLPFVVKKATDHATALQYQSHLRKLGLHSDIRSQTPALSLALVETPDHPAAEPQGTTATTAGTNPSADPAPAAPGQGTFLYAVHKRKEEPEAPAPSFDEPRDAPFRFHGNGFEYFRIWIVNLLLTIVTLGIYSAWAKVRRMQYFYGNTEFEGNRFRYHGDPKSILKGRLIGLFFFGVYAALQQISPLANAFALLLLLGGMPLMIWGTLRFKAANTSFRNIRFRFSGTLGECYRVNILGYALSTFTAGLASPIAWRWFNNYAISNTSYGRAPFAHNAGNRDYYAAYFRFVIGLIIAFAVIGGLAGAGMIRPGEIVLPVLLAAGSLAYFYAWWKVVNTNLVVNHTTLNDEPFESRYEIKSFFVLQLTNALGLILTLGLFWPWAQTRNAAYRAEHITLCLSSPIDAIRGAGVEEISTIGEETGGFFDVDIGF